MPGQTQPRHGSAVAYGVIVMQHWACTGDVGPREDARPNRLLSQTGTPLGRTTPCDLCPSWLSALTLLLNDFVLWVALFVSPRSPLGPPRPKISSSSCSLHSLPPPHILDRGVVWAIGTKLEPFLKIQSVLALICQLSIDQVYFYYGDSISGVP